MATSLGEPALGDGDDPASTPAASDSEASAPHPAQGFWNLPNTITVVRTAIIPMLLAFPLFDGPAGSRIMAWAFIVAAVGDLVDGYLARRHGTVTKVGQLLDPLADKLTVAAALIVVMAVGRLPEWSYLLVVVIIGRELAVTGLRGIASAGGHVIAAASLGKTKTVSQNVAIGALLFPAGTLGLPNHQIGLWLLVVAAVLTLISGYAYFRDYFAPRPDGPASQENAE
ncbi:MAG: CDP-diacylglycerol--glycerol-3-phosphate 3-phosphatidyltransferase [Myxococcota bacterium]|nr:CDP-diacylglycerol--glycerol-3-phosphate 3-phosphatidyltransferase [Myxococcota bacterium]